MARGSGNGMARPKSSAARPKAPAAGGKTSVPNKAKVRVTPPGKPAKARRELQPPPDLKAMLPYFLIRIAVFVVFAAVLIIFGVNVIWSLLIGMAAAAVATYPVARIQKRVARRKPDTPGK